MTKKIFFILVTVSILSLFINMYKKTSAPACFTTDEAAFGYNAYSLLKTAKDEYGTFLPLRLKSFGDYKMPLYSYLSIPFIALGGLNEISARALNTFVAVLFPFVIFGLTYQFLKSRNAGLLAALFFSLSPAIQMIGRQAHEAYLTTFLICLSVFLLYRRSYTLFLISLIPLSFGYQFSRLWLVFIMFGVLFFAIKKYVSWKFFLVYIALFFALLIPDILVRPARVNNLLFFNNIGLGLQTAELRSEGGIRLVYNKATVGLKNLLFSHMSYFSPQFLVIQGDDNKRFGYEGISPITIVEYLLLFVGIYYLFKDKQKFRFILIALLFISPLASSLSWAGYSTTRSLPMFIFIYVISAYGLVRLQLKTLALLGVFVLYGIFAFYSWDFFFNHYPKRAQTLRAWQCGNREMAQYVKEQYDKTHTFYITKKNGQPYIFLLFYLEYDPLSYQKQAILSQPDEFGFGQVESFDKFNFDFSLDEKKDRTVSIGYPEDFKGSPLSSDKLKKINVPPEEIFWIYENSL